MRAHGVHHVMREANDPQALSGLDGEKALARTRLATDSSVDASHEDARGFSSQTGRETR